MYSGRFERILSSGTLTMNVINKLCHLHCSMNSHFYRSWSSFWIAQLEHILFGGTFEAPMSSIASIGNLPQISSASFILNVLAEVRALPQSPAHRPYSGALQAHTIHKGESTKPKIFPSYPLYPFLVTRPGLECDKRGTPGQHLRRHSISDTSSALAQLWEWGPP